MTITTTARPEITAERIAKIKEAAYRIRTGSLIQGEVQGQGYIGQALDFSDVLAVLYADQLHIDPTDPDWDERDRCQMSMGHYGLALYAALAYAGYFPWEELETYATDDSRLPMSSMSTYTPGVEISGGSLGHGLVIANGVAMAMKRKGIQDRVVYNLLSDGEVDEGSTWEAAAVASHHKLDNLIAIVDYNNQQADGPSQEILVTEPITKRFEAFGWVTRECDGNDVEAVLTNLEDLRYGVTEPKPRCLVVRTKLAKGVDFLETREKLHFMKVEPHEWALAHQRLKEGMQK